MSDRAGLPRPWTEVRLEDVAHLQLGKMLDKARPKGSPHRYLRNINVRWDAVDTTDVLSMAFEDAELERFSIRDGDLLVCEGGEPGRAAVWKYGSTDLRFQKALHRVRFFGAISGRWAMYQLMLDASTGRLARAFTGSTIAHLPREKLAEYQLRIAPGAEQERIIDAVDSYVSRLDATVATLEAAQIKLNAYRASVLKAAVEGRLVPTEAALARAEKRHFEPADVLLKRILSERRLRWEETALAKLKAAGKSPRDDKWKAKYEEPKAPDTKVLPELPAGWCWTSVNVVADVKGGVTKGQRRGRDQELVEVPYLRVANVQRGYLDLTEVKTIAATPAEVEELRLEAGDVLFNEGGDRDKLGRGWVWGGEIPTCIHQNHVFRARIVCPDLRPRFLSWYGNSSGQRYFFDEGKQTTNLASINMTKLKALPVPLPPRAEQDRIAEEVERLLSIADEINVGVAQDIRRCQRLRQAILKWAFEGKLVDQDPNDEPAEKLLERIRAECGNVEIPKKTRRARNAQ